MVRHQVGKVITSQHPERNARNFNQKHVLWSEDMKLEICCNQDIKTKGEYLEKHHMPTVKNGALLFMVQMKSPDYMN